MDTCKSSAAGPCASPFEASNQLYTDSCNFYGFMNGIMLGPHASFRVCFSLQLSLNSFCVQPETS